MTPEKLKELDNAVAKVMGYEIYTDDFVQANIEQCEYPCIVDFGDEIRYWDGKEEEAWGDVYSPTKKEKDFFAMVSAFCYKHKYSWRTGESIAWRSKHGLGYYETNRYFDIDGCVGEEILQINCETLQELMPLVCEKIIDTLNKGEDA